MFQWPFQSLKQMETRTFMHTKTCRKRNVSAYVCLNRFLQHRSVIFPAMVMWSRGCCSWQAATSRQTLSTESLLRALHRAEFTKNRTDRSSQAEYKPLTEIISKWDMENRFIWLYIYSNSICMCTAYSVLIPCASQENEVRHLFWVKPLVFHKPFGKIRF